MYIRPKDNMKEPIQKIILLADSGIPYLIGLNFLPLMNNICPSSQRENLASYQNPLQIVS